MFFITSHFAKEVASQQNKVRSFAQDKPHLLYRRCRPKRLRIAGSASPYSFGCSVIIGPCRMVSYESNCVRSLSFSVNNARWHPHIVVKRPISRIADTNRRAIRVIVPNRLREGEKELHQSDHIPSFLQGRATCFAHNLHELLFDLFR